MRALVMLAAFSLGASIFPAQGQEARPEFDISATQTCFQTVSATDKRVCIGLSANICMDSEFGGSTVGMGACIDSELQWWDAKLNDTYGQLLQAEQADDEEAEREGYSAPKKSPALKDMQRKWIPYRDAVCEHEAVQWGGGTGAGPAFLGCLLDETARQAILLMNRLESNNR